MLTVHIDSGAMKVAMNDLARLSERPRSILQAAARSVVRSLQDHFRDRDQKSSNRLGGHRTHWWASVARSTQIASIDDTQAVVSISEPGFGLKVGGGTIRPKLAKWLAIPATAEAHGRRPKTYTMTTGIGLRFVPAGSGKAMLVQAEGTLIGPKRKGKHTKGREVGGLVVYWLRKSVTQSKDPNALPDRDKLEHSALDAAEAQLRSIAQRNQSAR
ncbi:MAG TPA: hypothetical protein PKM73_19625 [Verrucomicrobiota bacterium]|nr:hypothetical protein [Verrucomicrobiota bacterium]HNU52484.1 hypothetical protein [Verrucomicrobiota bacterium]